MRSLLRCLSALTLALPIFAQAGTIAVYERRTEPGRLVFEIAGNGDFRAGAPGARQYRLVLGGENYQVAELDGKPVAARLGDIEAVLRSQAQGAGPGIVRALSALAASTPQRLVRKGPVEVNGWQGELYIIRGAEWEVDRDGAWQDPNGAPYYVVSRDPALRQLGPALTAFTAGELAFGRHLLAGNASRLLLDTLNRLAAQGTLVESSEEGLQLARIEQAEPDPARLALPAPPLSLDALAALVKAGRSPFRQIAP
jgi:hypothetical protein